MQRVLRRRVPRDLRANWVRYLALAFTLVLSLYLVISVIGAADTLIAGSALHAEQNGLEDGEFEVFVPLTDGELKQLEARGAAVEPMFSLDYPVADGSTLRVFAVRERINRIELTAGALPKSADEAVLERRYCEEKGIRVGDGVDIGGAAFTVCGIGATPDYDAPFRTLSDSSVDSGTFGTAFVTGAAWEALRRRGGSARSEEYVYAYKLVGGASDAALEDWLKALEFDPDAVDDEYFRDYWDRTAGQKDELLDGARELADGADELRDALRELTDEDNASAAGMLLQFLPENVLDAFRELTDGGEELADGADELRDALEELAEDYLDGDASNLTRFTRAADNPRIGAAADDQAVNLYAGLLAGVIILALLAYVISVFVVNNIEAESGVIGALYALGARRGELLRHYMLLPVVVTFVSGLIGTALGYSPLGVPVQTADCYAYFSLPDIDTIVNPALVAYGVLVPPLVAAAVNALVIRKKLSVPALRLMRRDPATSGGRGVKLGRLGFIARFRVRQLGREGRSAAAICLGLLVTLLLMMIGLNAWTMCEHIRVDNVRDTRYEYMYLYKYPEEEVPEGGCAACAKTLKRETLGYDLDVTVLGIGPDNPYFDADPEPGESKAQISSAMAQKYGLKAGDTVVLSDREKDRDYAFTVTGVVTYSPAFFAFMDIDSMRELFDLPKDYFNVAFSSAALDIPAGRLYSVSTRRDAVEAADVFVDLMKPMVYTMTGCSALILAIVMYLMMKVTLDHSAYGIALLKILGYRPGELRRLYLDGGFILVALGAAVCVPLAKLAMDAMYPMLISNVACGMDLTFPWQLYAGIYGGVLALYFVINRLLMRRIRRVSPVVVLKNRD